VHYPQERLWQLILLTAFPNTCSLTSHEMSFAVLPVFDCVSTPSVVRLWHGTPGPPLLVVCVELIMMSKMSSISFFTAHSLMWFLFAGDLRPYSQRQECRTYLPFWTRTTTNSVFYYMNLAFYEQASGRAYWLRPFSCKPCKPTEGEAFAVRLGAD